MLKGKNIVITGCLKGIGRSTMELCASYGANIWACCQAQDPQFEADIKALSEKYGVWIQPVYFDLMDEEHIKNAIKTIRSLKEPIHALINIAGMTQDALYHMMSMKQLRDVFEVNFFSQILFTQYITKLMLRTGGGSVINISSISAIDGNVGQLAYSSSKAAIIGATKTLSAELAPSGIRVNVIAPGVIETEMTKAIPEDKIKQFMDKSALKRLGLPEEVAGAIIFLASDLSSYVTGQIIRVDGGMN